MKSTLQKAGIIKSKAGIYRVWCELLGCKIPYELSKNESRRLPGFSSLNGAQYALNNLKIGAAMVDAFRAFSEVL